MLPKQSNIVKGKEIGYSSVSKSDTWSQSNRTSCSIIKNKTEFRPTNKQQLKEAEVKAQQSISRAETQHLVLFMTSARQAFNWLQRVFIQALKQSSY